MSKARDAAELLPSTCLKCRAPVFCWQGAGMAGGGPLLFDLVSDRSGRMLLVHGCCFDDDEDDDGDPDAWGEWPV